MTKRERIIKVIFDAADDVNQLLPKGQQLEKTLNDVLIGMSGKLDSLQIITFITAVEQKAEDEFGISLAIADEQAMSLENSPFRTLETLVGYIELILEKKHVT